jgi:hypothetical protein
MVDFCEKIETLHKEFDSENTVYLQIQLSRFLRSSNYFDLAIKFADTAAKSVPINKKRLALNNLAEAYGWKAVFDKDNSCFAEAMKIFDSLLSDEQEFDKAHRIRTQKEHLFERFTQALSTEPNFADLDCSDISEFTSDQIDVFGQIIIKQVDNNRS